MFKSVATAITLAQFVAGSQTNHGQNDQGGHVICTPLKRAGVLLQHASLLSWQVSSTARCITQTGLLTGACSEDYIFADAFSGLDVRFVELVI